MKESPEKARQRVRLWQRTNPAARADKQRAYRKRHPDRYKARMAVQSAIRNGTLTRPDVCKCGSPNPQAHHADYSSPLDVTWLCRTCHLKEHDGSLIGENVNRGPRKRDKLGRFATIAAAALVLVPAAHSDHYGTTPARARANAQAVYRAFGGGYAGSCAVRIMWRESGGNEYAANYHDSNGGSYGLLQLNGVHRWRGESLEQFRRRMWSVPSHLAAAVRLYRSDGFAPWRGCP